MGIRGLTGWIRWAAPSTIKKPNWEAFKGKKIGIDILGFLYRAKAQHKSIFIYLGQLLANCKRFDITPVPIFDGKPPDEKRGALKQRAELREKSDTKKKTLTTDLESVPMSETQRKVVKTEIAVLEQNSCYLTSEERDQAKQLFYACGVLFLNATGEADNLLAYFSKRGEFVAVISNDLDLLARGVENLLVPEDNALPGATSGWIHYSLPSILDHVNFHYTQFLEMCVLMGCDYTTGLKTLQYKSAFWAIKYSGNLDTTLTKLKITNSEPYTKAIGILQGVYETESTLMGTKQWDRWGSSVVGELEALEAFRKEQLLTLTTEDYTCLTQGLCKKVCADDS